MQPPDKGKPADRPGELRAAANDPTAPVVLLTLDTPWGTMTVTVNLLWVPAAPPPV